MKRYSIYYWDTKFKDWASDSDTDTDDLALAQAYLSDHAVGWIEDNITGERVQTRQL